MNILITGSSGFVGTYLIDYLIEKGHRITAVDAAPLSQDMSDQIFSFIRADTTRPGPWQDTVRAADVIINLTGKNIFHLWTKKYKQMIYDSRILTTRNIVAALPENTEVTLINTSAAGYYGNTGDAVMDETKEAGDDFLARVCIDWEKEALAAADKGARVIYARFGVVLGRDGGALSKMAPAYRLFVGGPLGDGRQWFSWIHVHDLARAMGFVADYEDIDGPVNFCSPNPVRNNEFSKTLGSVLNRPAFSRVPAFALRLAAGELGELMLNSQRIVPARLTESGFSFQFPNVSEALQNSLN